MADNMFAPKCRWISVKDRLPEENGVYIVRSDSGNVYTDHFYAVSHKFTKRGRRSVTHWMPLPEWEEDKHETG